LGLALVSLSAAPATAQSGQIDGPVHAPPGAVAIPLYGKATPGSPSDEIETRFMGQETVLRNITYPTLTPVLPAPAKANGAAVIVAPGGGFMMLSMQNEGWRVAQALADHGIAAFVLKYRLNPTPKDDTAFMQSMGRLLSSAAAGGGKTPEIHDPGATQDALAALKLVRGRAAEWRVDPNRVGMIGFSAGAMATLKAVLDAPADGDPNTTAPDFFGYIYGPMAAVKVPADAPPMFAALAMDDPLFGNGDFSIVSAWHAAKRPVELHVYQTGSHGFGLGRPGTTTTLMMDEFLAWLDMQGILKPKVRP
jgi:acetyl esterase/lipase